ncbi:MAG: hypothetical protein LUE86_14225 [Clostridiales bacterium]|nr:hypothetical protein [Clostridiales bacterium]
MAKKKLEIKIGPLTLSAKSLLAGIMVLIAAGGGLFAVKMMKDKKAAEVAEQAAVEATMTPTQRVYAASEITGGTYYIKDGDNFYPVVSGTLYSSAKNDTAIAKIADPANRILMFGSDDATIPTMYSDSSLVFKAQDGESIPQEFILERFSDNGWSVGIRGLSQITGGNLRTVVDGFTFYPGSSISSLNVSSGNELIFDKIDGLPFGSNILSSVGTIDGLEQGKSYKLDAYVGTNYVGMEAIADTHIFISMERYSMTEYSMDPSGYMIVSFPHDLWSGYYYINGLGVFRYINQPKSMGDSVEDFNTPYYITDCTGNETINPASGYGNDTDNDRTWDYTIPVPSDTSILEITVTFQGSLASGTPDAKLISPNGGEYPLELKNDVTNTLYIKTEFPQEGTWTVSMSNMASRVFDVSVSFGESVTGQIEISKTDEKQAEMHVELPEMLDATLTFTWDNTEYAGNFLVVGPNGESYGNSETPELVQEANYGRVVLHPGYTAEGEYKIYVTGKALGNVAFSYEENGTELTVEETVEEETMETTEEEFENGGEDMSVAP